MIGQFFGTMNVASTDKEWYLSLHTRQLQVAGMIVEFPKLIQLFSSELARQNPR